MIEYTLTLRGHGLPYGGERLRFIFDRLENPLKHIMSPGQVKKAAGCTPDEGAFIKEGDETYWVHVIPSTPKMLPTLLGQNAQLDSEIAQNLGG